MAQKEMSQVVLTPCASYKEETVYEAVKLGLSLLGGLERFVKKEEKILVKPNFLSAADPQRAVTTHPAVIRALLRILQEEGYGRVTFGDSPGHGTNQAAVEKLGLGKEQWFGASLADMSTEVYTKFEQGMTAREFYFARGVAEADAVISLCKMKTHQLERITGAVKNVYGFICGYRKAAGHVKYPNAGVFARMLADIHRCVKPRLHIMDGIVAMEGNGPGSGDPTPMKVLLLSEDPVALDALFCHLVALDPEMVPTNVHGEAMGIGTYHRERIRIVTPEGVQSLEEVCQKYGNENFDVDRKGTKSTFLGRYSDFMTRIGKRPVISRELCVKCGICVQHCPVPGKAVDFKNGRNEPPAYDYKKCIRCYCCQEMCPQRAITAGRRRRT